MWVSNEKKKTMLDTRNYKIQEGGPGWGQWAKHSSLNQTFILFKTIKPFILMFDLSLALWPIGPFYDFFISLF